MLLINFLIKIKIPVFIYRWNNFLLLRLKFENRKKFLVHINNTPPPLLLPLRFTFHWNRSVYCLLNQNIFSFCFNWLICEFAICKNFTNKPVYYFTYLLGYQIAKNLFFQIILKFVVNDNTKSVNIFAFFESLYW